MHNLLLRTGVYEVANEYQNMQSSLQSLYQLHQIKDISILVLKHLRNQATAKRLRHIMSSMIPISLDQLPPEEYIQLLPDVGKTNNNTLAPNFLASSSRIFWDTFDQWDSTLLSSEFSQNSTQPSSTVSAEQDSFKDENYEAYWGRTVGEEPKGAQKASGGRSKTWSRKRS
ncbi:hypothetical protein K501DRAFT_275774 [Backusella circina FSU 941]|nr:hypothetical protein K501DRAFT_275774 [Backusella circina FSU 941]